MNIPVEEVIVGTRFRSEYGELTELRESIRKFGVLQPIVLDRSKNLLAGGRRLEAAKMLGLETIPANYIDEVDPLRAREIELEENIQRKDMDFSEKAKLVAEIHRLKQSIYGAADFAKQSQGWSQQDTAESLGKSQAFVSRNLALAEALEIMPELEEAGSLSVAVRLVERRLQSLEREVAIRRCKDNNQDVLCGDSLELIKSVATDSVDLIITDPPYGTNLGNISSGHRSTVHFDDSKTSTLDFLSKLVPELRRVLKPGGHIYMFTSFEIWFEAYELLRKHGFGPDPMPIIWIKDTTGTVDWDRRYAPAWEPILYATGDGTRLLEKMQRNWFAWLSTERGERLGAIEKPLVAAEELLELSSRPGEVVFDPCCGSGFVAVAAAKLGRKYICFDKDPDQVNITKLRLKLQAQKQIPKVEDLDETELEQLSQVASELRTDLLGSELEDVGFEDEF